MVHQEEEEEEEVVWVEGVVEALYGLLYVE